MELLFIQFFALALIALPVAVLARVIYCLVKWLKTPKEIAGRAVARHKFVWAAIIGTIILICEAVFVTAIILFFTAVIADM